MNLPELDGWVTYPRNDKPCEYEWNVQHFDISARPGSVDVCYDFDGRLGGVDLMIGDDPDRVEELALALLAAVKKARELTSENRW